MNHVPEVKKKVTPAGGDYLNNFDLWRLIAALQVAAVHAMNHLGTPGSAALAQMLELFPGVPIFFLISGFLVSGSWARSHGLRDYAVRRSLRIFPGLWCCLLVGIVSVLAFSDIRPAPGEFAAWLFAQLTMGQFYNPDFLRGYGVGVLNGSLWTIPVELQFYMVLPLVFRFLGRGTLQHWLLIVVLLALAAAVNRGYYSLHEAHSGRFEKYLGVTFLPHIYFFFLGMMAYGWKEQLVPLVRNRLLLWLAAYAASVWLLAEAGGEVRGNGISPVLAPVLGLLVLSGAYSLPNLAERLLRGNDISYGTYIYHMLAVNLLVQLHFTGQWRYWCIAMIATVALAILSWTWVERPGLKLKRKVG